MQYNAKAIGILTCSNNTVIKISGIQDLVQKVLKQHSRKSTTRLVCVYRNNMYPIWLPTMWTQKRGIV